MWAFAAVLIITGVTIDHNIDQQKERAAEQRVDEAVRARESAEKAKDDTAADRDAKAAESAEKQRQIDELTKQLQAKRDAEATLASNSRSNTSTGSNRPSSIVGTVAPTVYAVGCHLYEPLVREIWGSAAAGAMIVMNHESGCDPNAISPTNDHGLFQLNGQPIYEPRANITAAYQKYVSPRRGSAPNFSAWYAVCTPQLVPLYPGIWCS